MNRNRLKRVRQVIDLKKISLIFSLFHVPKKREISLGRGKFNLLISKGLFIDFPFSLFLDPLFEQDFIRGKKGKREIFQENRFKSKAYRTFLRKI